jgi:glycosyltransferase involved in cell wall biosynthesis
MSQEFYLIAIVLGSHIGVERKMAHYCDIAISNGIKCECMIIKDSNLYLQYVKLIKLGINKNDIGIVLRYPGPIRFLFLLPALLTLRIMSSKIYIEIPTPLSILVQEIKQSRLRVMGIINIIILNLSPPIIYLISNKVIQYGNENKYFGFFLNRKTSLIANPFIGKVFARNRTEENTSFTFVNCSYINEWHGLDRLIRGIYFYLINKGSSAERINLNIVGDGPIKNKLQKLVNELGLADIVHFYGEISGEEFDKVLLNSSIGVGTLGSHRVGLDLASPLKHRDYFIYGLPMIIDVKDLDFDASLPFIYSVANSNQPLDIDNIIKWYKRLLRENMGSPNKLAHVMHESPIIKKNDLRVLRLMFGKDLTH